MLERLEGRAVPATITVTSLGDSGPGTLREAILQAEMTPDRDTIDFAPAVRGTITLGSALPDLTGAIALTGPGASALTVGRNAAAEIPRFRILTVVAGAEVALSGLTITGGVAGPVSPERPEPPRGGGIQNSGMLTIVGCTISGNMALIDASTDNPADISSGGGIANLGMMTITASTISDNSSSGTLGSFIGGQGGGIANSGTLAIDASTLSGNTAQGGGFGVGGQGGGIANSGTLAIDASTLSGNTAQGGSSTVVGGSADGGAIFNTGLMRVTASTFTANTAHGGAHEFAHNTGGPGNGGAIANWGSLSITGSTFRGNTALPGGLFIFSGPGGGAISNSQTGILTVTNSTISGNSATDHDSSSGGGGIANSGTLAVVASTLGENSEDSASRVFDISSDSDNGSPAVFLLDDLFASSSPSGSLSVRSGTFLSLGHNLFADAPDVALDPTDLVDTDPLLGPLADNGGPTMTRALLPGSPAIDAGVAVPDVTTDQRGIPRPQGIAPDIGAFEAVATATIAQTAASAPIPAGREATVTATVTGLDGAPQAGIPVSFQVVSGPDAGIRGTFDPLTGPDGVSRFRFVGSGGTDMVVVTARLPEGVKISAAPVAITFLGTPNPPVNPTPPAVLGLHRLGFHAQPTRLVLSFSAALDPARAQDLANYRLVQVGFHHTNGHPIPLVVAHYDPAADAVTLSPSRRLPLRGTYRLTVVGTPPGGLTDAAGTFLDGAGTGQPGSDFVAVIDRSSLVRPRPNGGEGSLGLRRFPSIDPGVTRRVALATPIRWLSGRPPSNAGHRGPGR